MNINDSITNYDGSGISTRGVNALQAAGIHYWWQAKLGWHKNGLSGLEGVGSKTIAAVRDAKPIGA